MSHASVYRSLLEGTFDVRKTTIDSEVLVSLIEHLMSNEEKLPYSSLINLIYSGVIRRYEAIQLILVSNCDHLSLLKLVNEFIPFTSFRFLSSIPPEPDVIEYIANEMKYDYGIVQNQLNRGTLENLPTSYLHKLLSKVNLRHITATIIRQLVLRGEELDPTFILSKCHPTWIDVFYIKNENHFQTLVSSVKPTLISFTWKGSSNILDFMKERLIYAKNLNHVCIMSDIDFDESNVDKFIDLMPLFDIRRYEKVYIWFILNMRISFVPTKKCWKSLIRWMILNETDIKTRTIVLQRIINVIKPESPQGIFDVYGDEISFDEMLILNFHGLLDNLSEYPNIYGLYSNRSSIMLLSKKHLKNREFMKKIAEGAFYAGCFKEFSHITDVYPMEFMINISDKIIISDSDVDDLFGSLNLLKSCEKLNCNALKLISHITSDEERSFSSVNSLIMRKIDPERISGFFFDLEKDHKLFKRIMNMFRERMMDPLIKVEYSVWFAKLFKNESLRNNFIRSTMKVKESYLKDFLFGLLR